MTPTATTATTTPVVLQGCRAEPLAAYLRALGVLRAVATQADPAVRGRWRSGLFVADSSLSESEVTAFFLDAYRPTPIVSPWNGGSGFRRGAKSPTAEERLNAIAEHPDGRLDPLREAISAARETVQVGLKRGWGGRKDEFWDKAHKKDFVLLCRNSLPDEALPWLDAAIVLGQELEPTYNPLVGTGGNLARQDLSSTYYAALLRLFDPTERRRSAGWLRAALFGDEDEPYLRETVGQFDPGRAGGIQSSPLEHDGEGFANPWAFVLTLEGTLLFASAVTRRHNSADARAALPFTVAMTPVGYGSAAEESAKGELWAPQWTQPMSLARVRHLLGEGRAEWRGRPARNGLDFVRAATSLGVDRGVTAFTRYAFVERYGQSTFAVPLDRVPVREPKDSGLLGAFDGWLGQIARVGSPPSGVVAAVRRVERALYAAARDGGPHHLAQVLVEMGRLHEIVARSGRMRDQIGPFPGSRARPWLDALWPLMERTPELRLAAAFASLRDNLPRPGEKVRERTATFRTIVTPVALDASGRPRRWADTSLVRSMLDGERLAETLAEVHWRRTMDDAAPQPAHDDSIPSSGPGTVSAFQEGRWASKNDLIAFTRGRDFINDDLLADYLRGMLLLAWDAPTASPTPSSASSPRLPILDLLLPFFGRHPIRAHGAEVVLRPEAGWVTSLRSGQLTPTADAALHRLRIVGLRPGMTDADALRPHQIEGVRLAAALLLAVPPQVRDTAVAAVTLPKDDPEDPDETSQPERDNTQ